MKQILLDSDFVYGIMTDFMNGVTSDDENAFETAVQAFRKRYELKPEQEVMIRIALTHLEQLANHSDKDFNLTGFVGLECNIIKWIICEDYDHLNKNVLHDTIEGN